MSCALSLSLSLSLLSITKRVAVVGYGDKLSCREYREIRFDYS